MEKIKLFVKIHQIYSIRDNPDTLGRPPDHPDKEWNKRIVRTIWVADREYQGHHIQETDYETKLFLHYHKYHGWRSLHT